MTNDQTPSFHQIVILQDKICTDASLDQADFAALFGYINAITEDNTELTRLINSMSVVLTAASNTLKGEPTGSLISHSWHDLAQLVATQKLRMETAESLVENLGVEYSGNHALSDRQLLDDDDEVFTSEDHLRDNFADYSKVALEYRRVSDWVPLREQKSEATPAEVAS